MAPQKEKDWTEYEVEEAKAPHQCLFVSRFNGVGDRAVVAMAGDGYGDK